MVMGWEGGKVREWGGGRGGEVGVGWGMGE